MHTPIARVARHGALLIFAALTLAPNSDAGEDPAILTSAEGDSFHVREVYRRNRPVTDADSARASVLTLSSTGFLSTNQLPEGDMPRDVAFLADGSGAAIANRDTDTVTIFDLGTQSISASIPVGDFPVDVEATPDNKYLIVPCVFSNEVWVIDRATLLPAAAIPVTGTEPFAVRVTSDSKFAVVGVINDAISSAFSIIDLQTLAEVRSIATGSQGVMGFFFTPESGISGNLFTQFAVSSDNKTIVFPDRGGAQVVLYDLTNGATLATLGVAAEPTSVDTSLDGTIAIIGHEGSSQTVSVLDLVTPQVTASHATGINLVNQVIRVTPNKSHAIAAVQNAAIFLDLATGAVSANISTGTVGDIEISFDGQFAFVTNFNARVIDIASQTAVKTLSFAASYDAAASPVAHRMVALNNRFREDIHLYDTNGASGQFLGFTGSGAPAESDAPRTLAISADGQTVLIGNNISRNACFLDLSTRTVSGYVDTGDRVTGVAISPDGATAVVCNTDSNTVSILDVATATSLAVLPAGTRPAEVVISNDSQWAYVTSIAGADALHFIQLNGAASAVVKSLPTGQLGSIGYTYSVFSGIALSPDGATLAVCVSFDDQLMLVDTATQTEVARLPIGDFPIRAVFSPDSARCFVAHAFSDDAWEILVAGAGSSVGSKATNLEFPLQVSVDPAGAFLYVGSFDFSNPSLKVVDTATMATAATVSLPSLPRSQHFSPTTDRIYVTLSDGELARISAAGSASTLLDLTPLVGSPSDLAFSEATRTAISAQPGVDDGVDVVVFADECGAITTFGAGCAGSGGFTPSLALSGCPVSGGTVELSVNQTLGGASALLFLGTSQVAVPFCCGCTFLVGGLLPIVATLPLPGVGPGNGGLSFQATLPPSLPSISITMQAVVLDPGALGGGAATNGVQMNTP